MINIHYYVSLPNMTLTNTVFIENTERQNYGLFNSHETSQFVESKYTQLDKSFSFGELVKITGEGVGVITKLTNANDAVNAVAILLYNSRNPATVTIDTEEPSRQLDMVRLNSNTQIIIPIATGATPAIGDDAVVKQALLPSQPITVGATGATGDVKIGKIEKVFTNNVVVRLDRLPEVLSLVSGLAYKQSDGNIFTSSSVVHTIQLPFIDSVMINIEGNISGYPVKEVLTRWNDLSAVQTNNLGQVVIDYSKIDLTDFPNINVGDTVEYIIEYVA